MTDTHIVTAAEAVTALARYELLVSTRRIRTWKAEGALRPVGRGPRGALLYDLADVALLARAATRRAAGV